MTVAADDYRSQPIGELPWGPGLVSRLVELGGELVDVTLVRVAEVQEID
jgi:hypothetical protein